ncbi:Tfp pilus assembly protein FimT/FimU [Planctomycetota bacterium]
MRKYNHIVSHQQKCSSSPSRMRAFTLIEFIIVIMMISLFLLLAVLNFSEVFARNSFKAQIQELVSTMQMAANAVAQSNRRYEVIIDLDQQNYMLREITSPQLSQVLEEEIIVDDDLSESCWLAYVVFDDGAFTNEGQAKFRAGHSGWQYGGKVVLLDENDRAYSVIVNRLNRIIELKEGDVGFLIPRRPDEIAF